MKYIERKGVRTYYTEHKGEKIDVLFIHGWLHNHTVWAPIEKKIREEGYGTVCVDLRGHGRSDKPKDEKSYRISEFVLDIKKIISQRKKPVILVGHSMGGMIILSLMKKPSKHIHGIVLVNTTYENPANKSTINTFFALQPILEHAIKYLEKKPDFFTQEDINFQKHTSRNLIIQAYEGLKNSRMKSIFSSLYQIIQYNEKDVLETIQVPTLIIGAKKDKLTAVEFSQTMHEKIPHSTLYILHKASHNSHLEEPQTIYTQLNEYLKKTAT